MAENDIDILLAHSSHPLAVRRLACRRLGVHREKVLVDAHDLWQASRSLLTRVRDVLVKRFPDMEAHPAWQRWFPT